MLLRSHKYRLCAIARHIENFAKIPLLDSLGSVAEIGILSFASGGRETLAGGVGAPTEPSSLETLQA